MQDDFEARWRRARSLENDGNPAAAKEIYEAILLNEPERLYVRLRMSAIEQAQGDYRAARAHALRSAEAVRHGRWKDLAFVTKRLLAFDERSTVRSLIMGVDLNDPEIVKNSPVLAQHLWLIEETHHALRMIENAMSHVPSSPILSYCRAQVLRYLGRMEDATAEYERCLRMDPNYVLAHWSLAYHEKSHPAGRRVDRIRRTQQFMPADAPDQAFLHYALFKEFDDADDIDSAWVNLQAGARIKRRSIRYDSATEEQGFRTIEQLTRTPLVAPSFGESSSERMPIFIVGMPRSGTTVLERILGNHSEAASAGELNDFNSALCWEANHFPASFVVPEVVARLQAIDYAHVGANYLERTREKALGARYLIDKNPMNFVNAGFIGKALPQARIVCLRRDVMDSCLSSLKELFSGDAYGYSYDLEELADYCIRFHRMCEHWQRVMPDRFSLVEYENLVTDPLGTSEQVMKFCGMPFEPGCIDIVENEAPVSTASSSQVRRPINSDGVGAWRKYAKYLQPLETRIRDSLLSPQ